MTTIDKYSRELQMLLGVKTDDLDYLMYLLLCGGSYFKEAEEEENKIKFIDEIGVDSLEDIWKKGELL